MKRILFGLILNLLAGAARADAPEYSYFRAGYMEETLHAVSFADIDCSGGAFDFSRALGDHWAVLAHHEECEGDKPAFRFEYPNTLVLFDVEQELSLLGALYHMSLGESTDLNASIEAGSWSYYLFPNDMYFTPIKNEEENGYRLTIGVKSRFSEGFEGALSWRGFHFLEAESSITFDERIEDNINEAVVEGNYYFNEKISMGLTFISNDFANRFILSAGYVFE
ncbi:MAG TPA: hypothetical protein VFX02_02440 [Gammaproteobacteria bacterium]|nr:hypothetical protein [Gammaproteobacteria bacterium]